MKKMTKANAAKINSAMSKWNDTITVDIPTGKDTSVPVKLYKNINLADKMQIEKIAIAGAFFGGEYSEIAYKSTLSKCIVDFLTDIPVPTIKDEDNNDISDINLCYEIVYGRNGLKNISDEAAEIICAIEEFIEGAIRRRLEVETPVNVLAQKILDLYEYTKKFLDSSNEDLGDLFDMISSHIIDKDILDKDPVSKDFGVIDGGKKR